MIQSEEYKNRELYTKHGLIKFDEKGIAEVPNQSLEKKLIKMYTFELVKVEEDDTKVEEDDTKVEEEADKVEEDTKVEEQEIEKKKSPAKTTTRRKSSTTRTAKSNVEKDEK